MIRRLARTLNIIGIMTDEHNMKTPGLYAATLLLLAVFVVAAFYYDCDYCTTQFVK